MIGTLSKRCDRQTDGQMNWTIHSADRSHLKSFRKWYDNENKSWLDAWRRWPTMYNLDLLYSVHWGQSLHASIIVTTTRCLPLLFIHMNRVFRVDQEGHIVLSIQSLQMDQIIRHVTLVTITGIALLGPGVLFLCNSSEDGAPLDLIYGCPIFKWMAENWLHDRIQAQYSQQRLPGHTPN